MVLSLQSNSAMEWALRSQQAMWANLRCIAEYLEMKEDYWEQNLIVLTEAYLKGESVPQSIENSLENVKGKSVKQEWECQDWWVEVLFNVEHQFYQRLIAAMKKTESDRTALWHHLSTMLRVH
ncbi:hypothetical protein HPP92_028128 [Vanilla planifolia]|uniref:Uncharacterized protein n=1 Tax=Vanilla planifolia TaxID=51239 RepID=A0A835P6N4_VANPL|nr:hypothetical protein HPP92_028128 [Vanilla planifolia]KAG0447906.1 hypothetical protein HPP92_028108 [Vanilla planifolia]